MSSLINRVRNRPPIAAPAPTKTVRWHGQDWEIPTGMRANTYRQRRLSGESHERACQMNRKVCRSAKQGSSGIRLDGSRHPMAVWEPKKFSNRLSDDQKEVMG